MTEGNELRIGELATRGGLTADALRYYERLGLLPRARRTAGGFRIYPPAVLDRIRFIKQAQAHGLSLSEIRELLGFRDRGGRARCRQVRHLLTLKIADLDAKLGQLQEFRRTLHGYLEQCERALSSATDEECPVVDQLGGTKE